MNVRRKFPTLPIILLMLIVLVLSACGGDDAADRAADNNADNGGMENMAGEDNANANYNDAGADEEIGEEQPFLVIYGTDDRGEACQNCSSDQAHPDQRLQELAGSVAVLIRPNVIYQEYEGEFIRLFSYSLDERIKALYGAPLCEEERFVSQPAPGFCSGFLIDAQTLLTAKHCVPDQAACDNTRIIFNYQIGLDGGPDTILSEDIFSCESVQAASDSDFALVTLDRPSSNPPLSINPVDTLFQGDELAVIGHPNGLPKKIASNGALLQSKTGDAYFIASLDAFAGSSGSPVFDLISYEVVGMLVGGEQDYLLNDDACYEVKLCRPDGGDCSGELVLDVYSAINGGE